MLVGHGFYGDYGAVAFGELDQALDGIAEALEGGLATGVGVPRGVGIKRAGLRAHKGAAETPGEAQMFLESLKLRFPDSRIRMNGIDITAQNGYPDTSVGEYLPRGLGEAAAQLTRRGGEVWESLGKGQLNPGNPIGRDPVGEEARFAGTEIVGSESESQHGSTVLSICPMRKSWIMLNISRSQPYLDIFIIMELYFAALLD